MTTTRKRTFAKKLTHWIKLNVRYITEDIWRIDDESEIGLKKVTTPIFKTVILAIRGFLSERLTTRASALTYSTMLSIVPMLAVLIGIAKGFGFQETVWKSLNDYFPGHEIEFDKALSFVERCLNQAQGGIIIGVGLIFLLFPVISLIATIENSFNDIWQVKKYRPWSRRVSDYLAFFLIVPILITVSSSMSIFLSTVQHLYFSQFVFLTPMLKMTFKIIPYVIICIIFTSLYIVLPNTKVKFIYGLIGGVLAGCAFQFFQLIYISGQIWVSKYNAIYGSFAAIPLLLLWLQLSWIICLFGAEICFAAQNVKKFSFEKDSKNISRRYKDFLTMLITTLIIKRFVKGEHAYSADEISNEYHIPTDITSQILFELTKMRIITEVHDDDERIIHYQPAIDVNVISVGYLLDKIDSTGSNSDKFKIYRSNLYNSEWNAMLKTRKDMLEPNNHTLLKDL